MFIIFLINIVVINYGVKYIMKLCICSGHSRNEESGEGVIPLSVTENKKSLINIEIYPDYVPVNGEIKKRERDAVTVIWSLAISNKFRGSL